MDKHTHIILADHHCRHEHPNVIETRRSLDLPWSLAFNYCLFG